MNRKQHGVTHLLARCSVPSQSHVFRIRPVALARISDFRRIASRASVLAALAAPVMNAYAQNSTAIYGVLETIIEITNPGAGNVVRMDSGDYPGSRVGVRGVEDLGSGMAIIFYLESGFGMTDGEFTVANAIFNRQAWIGVKTRYGALRIGRQYSPIYIPFKGDLDAFGAGAIASGFNNFSEITPYVYSVF